MQKLRAAINWVPHWVFVGLALGAGAFWQNLQSQPGLWAAVTTWNRANLEADFKTALLVAGAAVIGWLKTDPWTQQAVAKPRVPPVLQTLAVWLMGWTLLTEVGTVVGAAAATESCTPAQQALFDQVDNLVLADIRAGDVLNQIETDVAKLVAGQPGADVVMIVDDALALLIDLNAIPPNLIPTAIKMRTEEESKLLAAGKHLPAPPMGPEGAGR